MLDTGREPWRKALRWVVVGIFMLSWANWIVLIRRHWGEMGDHVGAVGLLVFFPVPCIQMFVRDAAPPLTALFTYTLLGLALGIGFH